MSVSALIILTWRKYDLAFFLGVQTRRKQKRGSHPNQFDDLFAPVYNAVVDLRIVVCAVALVQCKNLVANALFDLAFEDVEKVLSL